MCMCHTKFRGLMKILVIGMHKGGVGKTLLARILSEYFALNNYKTLGIDLDCQCNYSRRFIQMDIDYDSPEGVLPPIHPEFDSEKDTDWDGRSSIADIYFNEPVLAYQSRVDGLDIFPGHPTKLVDAERVRKKDEHIVHEKLKNLLDNEEIKKIYDIVIIDTPPARGPLTIAALRAASHIIIPALMETQSMEGLYGMLQLYKIENLNRSEHEQLDLIGIQPNMFKNTKQHKHILNQIKESKKLSQYLSPVTLGHRTIFSEVDAKGATPPSVFNASNTNKAKQEATQMCEYVQKRIFNDG